MAKTDRPPTDRSAVVRPAIFAVALTAFIAIAILAPDLLKDIKVDTAFYLGVASFFLGLATSLTYLKSLLGRPGGLGVFGFSFFLGTFLWPALGLAASVLAVQHGLGLATAIGLVLLASLPVGGLATSVNVCSAGGSIECSSLMAVLSSLCAAYTVPYIVQHLGYAVLDLPEAAAAASTANAALRAAILTPAANGTASTAADSLTVSAAGVTMVSRYATHGVALPLLAGMVIRALLPSPLSKKVGHMALAGICAIIVASAATHLAGVAGAVRQAGLGLVGAVAGLHAAALALGYLIPAGVGADGLTCRTAAYQASMRNPLFGLALCSLLFGDSPAHGQLAAPMVMSLVVQNLLGCWSALAFALSPLPVSALTAIRATDDSTLKRSSTFKRPLRGRYKKDEGGAGGSSSGEGKKKQ